MRNPRKYIALNIEGKKIRTQYSPDTIMQVTELIDLGIPKKRIHELTKVARNSINFVASLDPIDIDIYEDVSV